MFTLNEPLHLVIPLPKVSGLSGIFLFAERVLHRHEGNAKLLDFESFGSAGVALNSFRKLSSKTIEKLSSSANKSTSNSND